MNGTALFFTMPHSGSVVSRFKSAIYAWTKSSSLATSSSKNLIFYKKKKKKKKELQGHISPLTTFPIDFNPGILWTSLQQVKIAFHMGCA